MPGEAHEEDDDDPMIEEDEDEEEMLQRALAPASVSRRTPR